MLLLIMLLLLKLVLIFFFLLHSNHSADMHFVLFPVTPGYTKRIFHVIGITLYHIHVHEAAGKSSLQFYNKVNEF